ncbi:MAG: FAD-binding oxidoreductase [Candidatus Rokubacteria bacterium]|nr:FAD-binding oxidoreductase [Candidatus Rokubacteria bacterium]
MAGSTRAVGSALAALLGTDALVEDAGVLARFAVDGCTPRWLARPSTVDAVARVMALATDEGLAVVPRGSGSTLALGAPPARLDLVLDMSRLDRVLEWNPDDLTVTVEAGVALGALAKRLGPRRQFLPLDPPAADTRTLGGLTATNASGALRVRYGALRDLLLGVRFVQPDGVVTWGGAKVVKSVSGYDVPKLMVGALGTLGVLCELTLRLHPVPDVERTWLVTFVAAEHAQGFLAAILDSALQPSRVEWLNRAALARTGSPSAAAALAVSIGSVEAAVAAQGAIIGGLAAREHGQVMEAPVGWWDAYAQRLGAAPVVLRVATLASHVAGTVTDVERRLHGACVSGCAAVGSLDVSVAAGEADVRRAVDGLRAHLRPIGGHVVVTRAPVTLRQSIDPWGPVDDGAVGLMRAILSEFDPRRVLNPGRFVGGL